MFLDMAERGRRKLARKIAAPRTDKRMDHAAIVLCCASIETDRQDQNYSTSKDNPVNNIGRYYINTQL